MKRIGIIGLNNKAIHHIERIKSINDFELVGLYDHNAVLAKKIAQKYGIQYFHHPIDLIEQSELVDFVAPHPMDFEHASMAIKSARHLFFEDSFLQDIEKTTKLMNLVDEAQVKVQISRYDRFNPAVVKARNYITNPSFIEIRRAVAYSEQSEGIDPIMEMLFREVDLILSFIDSGVRKIQTRTNNPFSSKVELINVRIEFDNSCVVNLNLSSLSSISYNKAAFYQDTGVIHINLQDYQLEILGSAKENKENKVVSFDEKTSEIDTLSSELKSFYTCIDENSNPLVGLRDVAGVLEIMDEIKAQISSSII
jgi:predicted dehydrogenase